jgi:hypothetical protein
MEVKIHAVIIIAGITIAASDTPARAAARVPSERTKANAQIPKETRHIPFKKF